jgi:hypothetical protein
MPFFSIRKEGYNTMQGKGVNLQQCSSSADASTEKHYSNKYVKSKDSHK